jgi:c-di-GMP-binding flagellar brake protein YcgR
MQKDSLDKRRFIRVKFPFTIHIYPSHKSAISAYTEDIGEGGVKVTLREPLEVFTVTSLLLYVQREPVACKGKIAWVKKRQSEYIEDHPFFDTGIEFQNISYRDREIIKERVEAIRKQREWAERRASRDSL